MNCNIVRDLPPLYHDGLCSAESRRLVEAHLAVGTAATEAEEAFWNDWFPGHIPG